MLLSLKPEIFELIRSGRKIFEYRHQFYKEEIGAYLYISKPIQKIVGYIEFDKRIDLNDWKEKYKDNKVDFIIFIGDIVLKELLILRKRKILKHQ